MRVVVHVFLQVVELNFKGKATKYLAISRRLFEKFHNMDKYLLEIFMYIGPSVSPYKIAFLWN